MLIWFLVVALLVGCYLYIEFTPRDADPHFVHNQGSISSTKFPGESATFRSLVNDHKHMLLGSSAPLKNFQFIRLWDEVKSFKIEVVSGLPKPQRVTNFEDLVALKQKEIGDDVEIEQCNLDALVTYFAAMLNGVVPRFPKFVVEDQGGSSTNAASAPSSYPAPAAPAPDTAEPSTATATAVNPIIQAAMDATTKRKAAIPATADTRITPTSAAMRVGSTEISETDLGVAIAAQLTAVGSQYRWSANDSVFIAPGPASVSVLVAMLTALSAKSTLVFAEMLDAAQLLTKARPTIMIGDDIALRTLAKQRDLFRIPQWIQYAFRRLRLSKGALTRPAMLPGFKSVRLIYAISGPDPQQWLDNGECADLRVLTGTQVVHVLAPNDGLPIAQTCVGDYRSSAKLPGTIWGPPVPGIELKVKGGSLFSLRANHTKFELVKTVDEPHLMNDGCLYVPVQRPIVSEEYFYTGRID